MARSPASVVRSPRVYVDVVSFLGESPGQRSPGLAVTGVTLRCFPALSQHNADMILTEIVKLRFRLGREL
jgi:hypothetical protein